MTLRRLAAAALVALLVAACADPSAPRGTTRSPDPPGAGRSLSASSESGTAIGSRLAPGKCMTVEGGTDWAREGAPLVIWECGGGANQRFSLPAPGTAGEVRVYDKCLDAAGGWANDGDPVIIWSCHGGANQQWTVTPDGEILAFNGKCVDVWLALPENGAQLRLHGCHGGSNQRWDVLTPSPVPPPEEAPAVLIAAGDIASCDWTGDEETAALVDGMPGTVQTLGDLAYNSGTASQFANCYDPSWGRHKARTRPAPGNHEYGTTGASGYFGYFGAAAGEPGRGYYSYDLGAWHVVVLNSGRCAEISCADTSEQVRWLRADLDAHRAQCTLAVWHHPRFNSGVRHGNYGTVRSFWNVLYEYGAEVILNGHEHVYERFGPQSPTTAPDPARGLRQFTVGTGGASQREFIEVPKANSEVRLNAYLGVLRLELRAAGYRWAFISTDGVTRDAGEGSCH
jgi:hypothetical protein